MGCVLGLADEEHPVALVYLHELDLDALASPGREVLADVVRPDRELAVPAIDKHRELHTGGAAELEKCVDGGANRPPRVENVVDEHDRHPLDREGDARRPDDRLPPRRPAAVPDVRTAESMTTARHSIERRQNGAIDAPMQDLESLPARPAICFGQNVGDGYPAAISHQPSAIS